MPFQLWLRHLARDRLIDAHRRHRGAARRSLDREQPLAKRDFDDQSALDLAALAADRELTPAAAATHHELELASRRRSKRSTTPTAKSSLMRHFEQLSNQETAQALELSEPAAGMRYLRAMRRLRTAAGAAFASEVVVNAPRHSRAQSDEAATSATSAWPSWPTDWPTSCAGGTRPDIDALLREHADLADELRGLWATMLVTDCVAAGVSRTIEAVRNAWPDRASRATAT